MENTILRKEQIRRFKVKMQHSLLMGKFHDVDDSLNYAA